MSELEDRLRAERPTPTPAFRGGLRRSLVSAGTEGGGQPQRLRLLIAAYGAAGVLLLLVALVGAAGAGPFAT